MPPVLARTVSALPVGPGWAFEPKFDGYRMLAFRSRTGVALQSRQQRMLTAHFPDVAAAVTVLGEEVLLDGELVIWKAGRFDFAALQDRLRSGPAAPTPSPPPCRPPTWCSTCSPTAAPTCASAPYRHRRAALETLLGRGPARRAGAHPVHHRPGRRPQLAARPRQREQRGYRGCGRETPRPALPPRGAGLAETTQPADRRSRRRRGHRPARTPRGCCCWAAPTTDGRLHLVGRTTELTPASASDGRRAFRPHTGSGHPWPNPLPSTRWGRPGPPTAYTPVRPDVVVELTVDTAVEHHRWRHPAHFVRVRADLRSDDLTPLPPIPASTPQPRRVQAG